MDQFFAGDYSGAAFELFGPAHLMALVVIVLLNGLLVFAGPRFPCRWRPAFRFTLATVLLVDELLWHYWNWSIGQWTIQAMLPLHLCSLLVFVSAATLVTQNYRLYEFVYFLGLAGATQAILTPDAGPYGFPHFRFFQVFVSHGSIVTVAVYLTAVERYRPTPRSLLRVAVGGNVYLLLVGLVNAIIGSNYLFIARKPDTASLLDVLPLWPWYIPIIELIGLVMIALLYLPFAWGDLKLAKSTANKGISG